MILIGHMPNAGSYFESQFSAVQIMMSPESQHKTGTYILLCKITISICKNRPSYWTLNINLAIPNVFVFHLGGSLRHSPLEVSKNYHEEMGIHQHFCKLALSDYQLSHSNLVKQQKWAEIISGLAQNFYGLRIICSCVKN